MSDRRTVTGTPPQPFVTQTERVAYGVWDEVHSLIPAQPVSLAVAA